jgi:hypothetical protein
MHGLVARGECRRVQSKVSGTKRSTNQTPASTKPGACCLAANGPSKVLLWAVRLAEQKPPGRGRVGDKAGVLCQPVWDENGSAVRLGCRERRAEPGTWSGGTSPGSPWRPPHADGALRKRHE